MADEAPRRYRTGWLWAVLTLFLLVGTVASATVVYGATELLARGSLPLGIVVVVGGAGVAALAFLFLAGLLYRVDRLRGVPHRTVNWFE